MQHPFLKLCVKGLIVVAVFVGIKLFIFPALPLSAQDKIIHVKQKVVSLLPQSLQTKVNSAAASSDNNTIYKKIDEHGQVQFTQTGTDKNRHQLDGSHLSTIKLVIPEDKSEHQKKSKMGDPLDKFQAESDVMVEKMQKMRDAQMERAINGGSE